MDQRRLTCYPRHLPFPKRFLSHGLFQSGLDVNASVKWRCAISEPPKLCVSLTLPSLLRRYDICIYKNKPCGTLGRSDFAAPSAALLTSARVLGSVARAGRAIPFPCEQGEGKRSPNATVSAGSGAGNGPVVSSPLDCVASLLL